MNSNEEQFPVGTRVRITEQYGGWDSGNSEVDEAYHPFHGQEAVVLEYADVNEPYTRIKMDNPPEDWAHTMLMLTNENEAV